jgi:molybdate transport system substrate-binding protein
MMMKRSVFLAGLLALLAAGATTAAQRELTVFAAASLTDVLEEVGKAYTAKSQVGVRFSFAASSVLARQVESGAPADAFISADREWMDYLADRNLLAAGTRVDVVTNSLVLVAPAGSTVQLSITPRFALVQALGRNGRLATGDPQTVPAGRYARTALTRLGVWESVAGRIIAADNVRTALNFVALGEAPLGIVYATDVRGDARVRTVATFPPDTHEPITYPAAVTRRGGPEAAAFVQYLRSEEARSIFRKYGFGIP